MINDSELREYVYKTYWLNIEQGLLFIDKGNKEKTDITNFFRYFLQCKKCEFISEEMTYHRFTEIYNTLGTKEEIDAFYIDALNYLDAYRFLTREKTIPSILKTKFDTKKRFQELEYLNFKLRYLGSDIRLSLFMDIFVLLLKDEIEVEEVIKIFGIFESYIMRLIASGVSISGLNQNIPSYFKRMKDIVKKNNKSYSDAFAHILLSISGRNIFRNNEVITNSLQNNSIGTYVLRYVYYILTTIEETQKDIGNLLRQMTSKEIYLTLEHIMPQTKSDDWRKMIGQDYDRVYDKYLNNIGNLTLTAYNSRYSNNSFKFKKECENGFNYSQLNINKSIKDSDVWTAVEIVSRQKELIKAFIKCFPVPETTIKLSKNNTFDINGIDENKLTKTKTSKIIIEEENETIELYCRDWKEVLKVVANYLYEKDPELFVTLCDDKDLQGTKNRLLGRDKKIATYTANDIVPNANIYFNNNLSANELFKFVKLLLQKYKIDETVSIEFENN